MRITLPPPWLCLVLSMPAFGEDAPGSMPQLIQLNRASQQELRDIQNPPELPGTAQPPPREPHTEQLHRRQDTEQQALQESQRREVLMRKQRAKVAPSAGTPYRLDAINSQRQYRMQQQNQLNRFRIQKAPRTR